MKSVVITGASSGIGAELSRHFAQKGWQVLMVARSKERLEALHKELSKSRYFCCDLADPSAIDTLVSELVSGQFNLNALINNAGLYRPAPFPQSDDEVWQTHFNNNLMSAVRLTRGLWPSLKSAQGAVLNISSTLAIRPIANTSAYSALKAAMNNWTLSLAIEGAAHGIRANAICPGLVDTPIHSFHGSPEPKHQAFFKQLQSLQPLGRTGMPQDLAPLAELLCSTESSWTTGTIINVDGGILLNS